MTTAQEIVEAAYYESRVTDPIDGPETTQLTAGLGMLNRIIGRLSVKQAFIPSSTGISFSPTVSTASYTMGSGGTASSTRPQRIISAYFQDADSNAHPLQIITEIEYNNITDKTTSGTPRFLFYDPVQTTAYIYFYPVFDASGTVYLEAQTYLAGTLALATEMTIPIEYEDALVLSLAARLARVNGSPAESSLVGDAKAVWVSIMSRNMAERIPQIPLPFSRRSGSSGLFDYNINTSFPYEFGFILS